VKLRMKVLAFLGALVLAILPGTALATGQPSEKAKAYGHYCNEESRKHVKGEPGTPFSQCVTAMAKLANSDELTPSQACNEMSREHVKGEKGTPFSQCVVAGAKLRKDQQD
jgi:hypothetical protein